MFLFLLSLLPFCIYSNLDGGNDIIAVNYKLTNILRDGIKNKYYPGVAAIAGNADNILYDNNLGYYTYIDDEMNEHDLNSVHPISKDTFFDIASVSKVIATTSAVALLVQNGYINVDDYVYKYMDDIEFKSHNKDLITVKHLLTHSSGLDGDPSPWYWEIEFPCPNTKDVYPQQDTSCVEIIYNNLLNSTLTAEPGTTYIYSDIGFLILQYMIGTVVKNEHLIEEASESFRKCPYYTQTSIYHAETDKQSRDHDYTVHMSAMNHIDLICYFEAYVRSEIFNFKPSGDSIRNTFGSDTMIHKSELDVLMPNTHYTSYGLNVNDFAPTMNDTVGNNNVYTNTRLQGYVGDGNCFAMGGICGHAGVFSQAQDIARFLQAMLRSIANPTNVSQPFFLNSTTIGLFTEISNETLSSRALGWDTNTDKIDTYGYDHSCGTMSYEHTFMHIGYTGTCVCVDKENFMFSVILTNRAYNCQGQLCEAPYSNSSDLKQIYKEFNTALMNI